MYQSLPTFDFQGSRPISYKKNFLDNKWQFYFSNSQLY
jgi:hypothetical protein